MLKFTEYREKLTGDSYITIFKEALGQNDFEISLLALRVLSNLSESLNEQQKLIEVGVLNIMCSLLQENKDEKLRR
jgi:hypothetical protein